MLEVQQYVQGQINDILKVYIYIPSRNIKGVVNDIFNNILILIYMYMYITDISNGIFTIIQWYIQGILKANTW